MSRQVAATDTVGVDIVVRDQNATVVMSRVERRFVALQSRIATVKRAFHEMSGAIRASFAPNEQLAGRMRKLAQTTSLLHSRLGQVMNLVTGLGPVSVVAAAGVYALFRAVKAAVGALVEAVRAGSAYARGIAEIMTISENSEFPIRKIVEITSELSAQYGVGVTESVKALYQAISAGAVTAAQAQDVLNSAAKLSIGGLTSMTNAVDVITASINAYALESLSATEITDTMFTAIRYGVTTGEQLSRNLGNVTTVAAEVGLTFQELGAIIATLTKRGIRTQKATIQLRQVLAQIIKPTAMASDEAARLGIEFDALAVREKGFLRFLLDIKNNAKFTSNTFAKLFGNVRALSAVFGLTIDDGVELGRQLEYMQESAGATDNAFSLMEATSAQLQDRLFALKDSSYALFGTAISESDEFKGLLRDLIEYMSGLAEKFKSESFKQDVEDTLGKIEKYARGAAKAVGALVDAMKLLSPDHKTQSEGAEGLFNLMGFDLKNWGDEAAQGIMKKFFPELYRKEFMITIPVLPELAKGINPAEDFVGMNETDTEFASKLLMKQARDAAQRRAREERDAEARREKADRARRIREREERRALREREELLKRVLRLQERGADLIAGRDRSGSKTNRRREIDQMTEAAKDSGSVKRMQDTLQRLSDMRAQAIDEMAKVKEQADLSNLFLLATSDDEYVAKQALDQIEAFVARYKDIQQDINNIDQATDTLKDEMARREERRIRQLIRVNEDRRRAAAEVASGLISGLGAMGQELIKFEGTSKELAKVVTKNFVQMAGDMITSMLRVAAVEKATAVQTVIANGAKAGSAVGADAAGKFGIFATVIAPPLIAAMVGMITALLDKFHEGGTMGTNGQRLPLNLGPGEYATIMRRGEVTIPSARSTVPVDSSPPPMEVHYHGHMLTDPSRARFTRHLDEDVAPALAGSISAGRVSLSNQRLYGRKS